MEEDSLKENGGNNSKKKSAIVLIILVSLTIGCSCLLIFKDKLFENSTNNKTDKQVDSNTFQSDYRLTGNGLEDFDLYFLQLENEAKNKIYSPLSIKYALAMLADGSDGDTKKQIEAVIGDYKTKAYPNNEHMSFANAMFIKDSFKNSILDSYTTSIRNKYNAEVIYDSFKNASNMNNWISKKTLNLLNNVLNDSSINRYNFLLVNALAINMKWNYQLQCEFNDTVPCKYYNIKYLHENYTDYIDYISDYSPYSKLMFNNTNEVKVTKIGASINKYDIIDTLGEENIRKTVSTEYQKYIDEGGYVCNPSFEDTINQYIDELNSNYNKIDESTDFYFYTNDDIKVFAKDLKTYDNMTLQYLAIMPTEENLNNYIKNLNTKKFNDIIKNIKEINLENFDENYVTKIKGSIPLFEFNYDLDLMKSLKSLGIKDIFDINKANLSKLTTEKQYIDVKHKANIKFSNDGITASAATVAGGLGATGGCFDYIFDVPVKEIDLTFDKPYLFIIRDKNSGEVWFAGTVYEPLQ